MKIFLVFSMLFSLNAMAVMETHVYSISLLKAQGKNKEFCASHGELEISTSDRLPLEAKFILLNSTGSADVITVDLTKGDSTVTTRNILTSGAGLNGEGDAVSYSLRQTTVVTNELDGVYTTQTSITENKLDADQVNLPNPELGRVIYTEDSKEMTTLKSILDLGDNGVVSIFKSSTSKHSFFGLGFGENYNYDCQYSAIRD